MAPNFVNRAFAVWLSLLFTFAAISDGLSQSTLIPLPTRRDMVFDQASQHLYITTSDGWVRPYDLVAGRLETGYNLGGSLNGVDISADDSFLLVAQSVAGTTEGHFHRLDLHTGAVVDIPYPLTGGSQESGAWDVVIAGNGMAFVSTEYPGSGGRLPLRQIDLATNRISIRSDVPTGEYRGFVAQNTQIHRGADRSRIFFLESGYIFSHAYTYDATTDTFGPTAFASWYDVPATAAVNRDGSLIGTRRDSFAALDAAPALDFLHSFSGVDSGVAFDAVRDLFYVVNSATDRIVAYNTHTFAESFRLAIGENIPPNDTRYSFDGGQFNTGTLVGSSDGRYLALATPSGIRLFAVPATPPAPPPTPLFERPRDMVFDKAGNYLYITTATGYVWPYDLAHSRLGQPFNVGGSLNGVDIDPTDSFLLIAEGNTGMERDIVHKLDLHTRQVTQLTYPHTAGSYENGTWDVAIAANGLAFVTTVLGVPGYSGWVPFRELNLATNVFSIRHDPPGSGGGGMITENSQIDRSADRTRLLISESNISSGSLFTYNSVTNTFGTAGHSGEFNELISIAVNRNGSLQCLRFHDGAFLYPLPNWGLIQSLYGNDSGVAFDAVRDILYAVRSATDQVVAYDTHTFGELFRVAIGENVGPTPVEAQTPADPPGNGHFSVGTLVASQNGQYLALIAPTAVRILSLANGTRTAIPTTVPFGNISTRSLVGRDDNVSIGGFIIRSSSAKKVALRAVGPSLIAAGLPNALRDPILELHDSTGALIASDDNWKDSQQAEIESVGLAPLDVRESVIIRQLSPGAYTAIMKGKNSTTGAGLVEIYDLDPRPSSRLVNISTRALVGTGDNVMIGGFIVANSSTVPGPSKRVLVRALGPSLAQANVPNSLPDPNISLYNGNGDLLAINDNWKETQRSEIEATGLAPHDDRESAIVATVGTGICTAIVSGNDSTGVALVEIYALD